MKRKSKGFTLIELMIVVAIVGIISAIAYPSYNSYMKKARRTDAKVELTKIADRQERYYLQNNTYTTNLATLGIASAVSTEGYYNLSITSSSVIAEFTVTATAIVGKAQATDTDTGQGDCTIMALSSTNIKTPTACW